ncbi:MAG: hypothetical protein IPJ30_16390 [Acidobacteria bacterium]|nr:hypothetical protein [Acidobacteriota bacterium]
MKFNVHYCASFHHRHLDAILPRKLDRFLVSRINVPDDAHSGSVVKTRSMRLAASGVPSTAIAGLHLGAKSVNEQTGGVTRKLTEPLGWESEAVLNLISIRPKMKLVFDFQPTEMTTSPNSALLLHHLRPSPLFSILHFRMISFGNPWQPPKTMATGVFLGPTWNSVTL